jgi:integrase
MPLSLSAARLLAAEVHRQRALGRDPIADNKARKHRQRAEIEERGANTFAAAARMFIEEHARPKTRRWYETARLLGLRPDDLEQIPGGLSQRWSDKPVRDIDGHDVWGAVDEARRVGVPGIVARTPGLSEARSRALFAALSGLFGWLQRDRKITQNPCAGLHRPSAPQARERVLTSDEVRWFWLACDAVGEHFDSVLKLLLLLGQRRNEVAGLRRDELSEDGATWKLPSSRTKNKRPHVVPLPAMARELIEHGRPGNLIFTTTGTTPVSGWSRAKARLDDAMLAIAQSERGSDATIPGWRIHDLRRTCITGMAELGIRPDVIELAVNHISGSRGGIAGVYNKSELLPERRAALERWSNYIEVLVTGEKAKILQFTKGGQ